MSKKGSLSINSDNIFPIIKKWLYSDHDIFYRELISNGCDAITKLQKLAMMGEYELPADYKPEITVTVDPDEKTIAVSDNGLGMTADEVEEYINQIAFSGATDFIEKYKDKATDDQIIGHFGLGFYSAFMVADTVEIDTRSYQSDAAPVHWTCDGGTEFEMEDGDRSEVGTTITLHLMEDCLEFCNQYRAREVLKKYCSFMPTEIHLIKAHDDSTQTIKISERLDTDEVIETIPAKEPEPPKEGEEPRPKEEDRLKIKRRPELINDTNPLWTRNPAECTDEDYKKFYRTVFNDYKEPLFWIHLNMDYPFNLKGILYFPKINLEYESIEGCVKLYNNQVFVADNIKEVIPEFLMLLKGVIDCPDLPLNVSRSALQNDGFVTKISDFISKKIADKLSGMCKTDREQYEKYWDDIAPFIKFGCLKDDKFCEKMTDYILFKDINGKYQTLPECLEVPISDPDEVKPEAQTEEESATDENGEKVEAEVVNEAGGPHEASSGFVGKGGAAERQELSDDSQSDSDDSEADDDAEPEIRKTIYYVTDEQQQGQYINMFKAQGQNAVVLTHNIDMSFISQLEAKNEDVKFLRIDADVDKGMVSDEAPADDVEYEEREAAIKDVVKKGLGDDFKEVEIKVERLKDDNVAALLTLSEQERRMQEMMAMYASGPARDMGHEGETLVLNYNHPLVQYLATHEESDDTKLVSEQIYDLAKLAQAPLRPEAMTRFIERSNQIMGKVVL